jgi:hypothetical protein
LVIGYQIIVLIKIRVVWVLFDAEQCAFLQHSLVLFEHSLCVKLLELMLKSIMCSLI